MPTTAHRATFLDAIFDRVDELRHRDPRQGLQTAAKVRDLVSNLGRERFERRRWLALQARAWAALGSAYRATFEFRRAEGSFIVALGFVEASEEGGEPDLLARSRLAQRAAYLRCDQHRFGEALALVDEAIENFESLGQLQQMGCALVDRGVILGRSGRPQVAIPSLERALDFLDWQEAPLTCVAAVHNLAHYLVEIAETPEETELAMRCLEVATRAHLLYPTEVNLLKLRELRGLEAVRRGDPERGLADLQFTLEAFERQGAIYDQATVLLHLAGVYLDLGQPEQVKQVAARLFPILRRFETDRETAASLMVFVEAAQTERATRELLARTTADVEKLSRFKSPEPPYPR